MCSGLQSKEQTGLQPMDRVTIRTIIIDVEFSFSMAGQWTHDVMPSTGSRSKAMRHSPVTRGMCDLTMRMEARCWLSRMAVLFRQEMVFPIILPDTASRSTLL